MTDKHTEHDRELARVIREALALAIGKKAADQALQHARGMIRDPRRRQRARAVRHAAGYGTLLAVIWHQRRAGKRAAA